MSASWGAPGAQDAVFGGPSDRLVGFRAILAPPGGGSGDEISLEISSWALLEVPKVVFWAPGALQERSGCDFWTPDACVRALLASRLFLEGFLAPKMSNFEVKNCVFLFVVSCLVGSFWGIDFRSVFATPVL